jgi:hypothetical protein
MLATLAPALSCAPSTGTGSQTERRPSRAVVTAEELSNVGELNLQDAITRLRPMWVRPRGVEATRGRPIVVYVDGVLAGGIQFLREIPTEEVVDVQFHDAHAAIIRWGRRDVAGVIEVTTR